MKLDFSKKEYDYFIDNCFFTDDEIKVLNMKLRGYYNAQCAIELGYSDRTICRIIKRIESKILKAI